MTLRSPIALAYRSPRGRVMTFGPSGRLVHEYDPGPLANEVWAFLHTDKLLRPEQFIEGTDAKWLDAPHGSFRDLRPPIREQLSLLEDA